VLFYIHGGWANHIIAARSSRHPSTTLENNLVRTIA
jgi:hypothetical protein